MPHLGLDRPIFLNGALIGVERQARWLAWPEAAGTGAKILVVDDIKETAVLFGRALRKRGHAVARAYNGVTGLAAARALHPELVLLNTVMPGLSGFDVLRELRADAAMAHTGVILTGERYTPAEQAAQLGAQGFLRLPCDLQAMVALAELVMARQ
jgi:twitching motility two-component system response regulator PilH